jgi:hypothetical protein
MRRNHVATALIVLSAGLTASAALRRFVGRRRPVASTGTVSSTGTVTSTRTLRGSAPERTGPARTAPEPAAVVEDRDAVVLRFAPRIATQSDAQRQLGPRCGDNGGRTKSGAPCAARGASGGRCHHHPVAA